MKLLDIVLTAGANTLRSKLRTILTVLAIVIGAFTLTLTTGLGRGISHYIDDQLGSLGANDVLVIMPSSDNGFSSPNDPPKTYDPDKKTQSIEAEGNRTVPLMTEADLDKIRKISGITSVSAYRQAAMNYISGPGGQKLVGNLNLLLDGEKHATEAGSVPANDSETPGIMIPSNYVSALGFSNADASLNQQVVIGLTNGRGENVTFAVTNLGVAQKSLLTSGYIYVNRAAMTKLVALQNQGVPESTTKYFQLATARLEPNLQSGKLDQVKAELKKLGFDGTTAQDQIGVLKTVINGIIAVLNGFAVIALLAAGFGIINTLLMSVQERTKEIGLMKALGMTPGRIFLLFSIEAVMLGFWGSFIGVMLAMATGITANHILMDGLLKDLSGLQPLSFEVASVTQIVLVVMGLAFLAGTMPAIKASRQDAINSLRYE